MAVNQTGRPIRIAVAALAGACLALAAASVLAAPAPRAKVDAPTLTASPTKGRIKLYRRPCDLASPDDCPSATLGKRLRAATYLGAPARFLVLAQTDAFGRGWVRLRLPSRPNDAAGWAPAELFELREVGTRIEISIRKRLLRFYEDGQLSTKTRVVVGAPTTPTPRGLFALYDLYRTRNDLRPYVLETTAHSEVLKTFMGGPGRVAIHGRHGALAAPLGTAVSNGCIRVPDRPLRLIARRAERGTPIVVTR